jgi:hypothetical protein
VERIRIDFSGPHLEHLRNGLDTTPDALRESAESTDVEVSSPLQDPFAYAEQYSDEYDDELAADLEVGLADELVDSAPGEGGNRAPGRGGAA